MAQSDVSKDFRVVIPVDIREKFKIKPGDVMNWTMDGNKVKVSFHKVICLGDIIEKSKK